VEYSLGLRADPNPAFKSRVEGLTLNPNPYLTLTLPAPPLILS